MKNFVLAILFICLALPGEQAHGQGFKTDSVFQHFDVDHVNVSDLTSVVRIPLFSWAQRGSSRSLAFVLTANTPLWYATSNCSNAYDCNYFYNHDIPSPTLLVSSPNIGGFGPGIMPAGMAYTNSKNYLFENPATQEFFTYDRTYVVDDSGASHELWVDANNPSTSRTIDGSGYLVDGDGIKDRSGRTITSSWGPVPSATNTIKDNDGNTISWTADIDGNNTWQDTVGRSVTISRAPDTDVSGCPTPPSGAPAPTSKTTLTVSGYAAPYVLCGTEFNINTNFWGNGPGISVISSGPGDCAGDPGCPAAVTTQYMENSGPTGALQSITLPDGRAWIFLYDSAPVGNTTTEAYGEIKRIILPTKGSIWYCYKHDWLKPGALATPNGNAMSMYISERVVDSDPTAPDYQCGSLASAPGRSIWQYKPGPASQGYAITITDPSQNDETVTYVPDPANNQYQNNTRTDNYYSGSGGSRQLIKSVVENIQGIRLPFTGDPAERFFSFVNRNSIKSTTLDGIAAETDSSTYDSSFNPAIKLCGFNPSTCQYKTAAPTGIGQIVSVSNGLQTTSTTYNWTIDGNFAAANLIDAPSQTMVSDSSSSSQTNYSYDDGSFVSNAGRGHLTGVTRVNDSGPNVTTHTHYDDKGMPDVQYDGKNHQTTITYDPTYHVFPISISKGIQSDNYTYNQDSGAVLSHTDSNGQVTHYGYDSGGRPTSIQLPGLSGDQFSTTLCYSDTNTAKIFQARSTPITGPSSDGSNCGSAASDTIIKTIKADGLARVISTILESAPGGAIQSDTNYDPWDRVTFSSTPHLGSTGVFPGTSTHYDPIGRITEVDTPFGVKSFAYAGLTSKSTDEIHNRKWITSDVLGRTSWVLEPTEPNLDPTIPTTYSYNVFGLTGAIQTGVSGEQPRSRSFRYNSLGQLKGAYNPETGLVCYGSSLASNIDACSSSYDLDGNLLAKTDARGVTTNYAYDDLDRLLSKTYTNDPSQTPTACYQYDHSSLASTNANLLGRLSNEWTQSNAICPSSIPSSGLLASRSILAYDAVGQVKSEQQCVIDGCGSPFSFSYSYDLVGNITHQGNGLSNSQSPQAGWTNSYDSANSLSKIVSDWPGHPPILFKADAPISVNGETLTPYGPFGLTAAQYGANEITGTAALAEKREYDNGGRLIAKNLFGSSGSTTTTPTTTTVTANPSTFVSTSTTTVQVNVNCNSACGQVDIRVDTTDLGNQTLDANGNFAISSTLFPASALAVGQHTVTAQYLGDSTHAPSSGYKTYTVLSSNQFVSLSMSNNQFTAGENSRIQVHVGCNSACGQVSLTVDGQLWRSWGLDSSGNLILDSWFWTAASPNFNDIGQHVLVAHYNGNSNYPASDSNVVTYTIQTVGTQQVIPSLTMSLTSFTVSDNSKINVHHDCNSACGQVELTIDGSFYRVLQLDGTGNASVDTFWWWTPLFAGGHHVMVARYLGNHTYAPASSQPPLGFDINGVGSQQANVTLTIPATLNLADGPITVHVDCNSACGVVQLTVDGQEWRDWALDSSGTLSINTFGWPTPLLTPGSHQVKAHYYGNSTYAAADSAIKTVTVPRFVSLSMSNDLFTEGENSRIQVHAACNSACGQITLTVDGQTWRSWSLDASGNLVLDSWLWTAASPNFDDVGQHVLVAQFSGSSNYPASDSDGHTYTIQSVGTQQGAASLTMSQLSFTTGDDSQINIQHSCNSACGQIRLTIDGSDYRMLQLDSNGHVSVDTFWWWTPLFTVGNHTLVAHYLGNHTYAPADSRSVGFAIQNVGTQQTNVWLSIPASFNPANAPITVHVDCNSACGVVQLTVDGNEWRSWVLDSSGNLNINALGWPTPLLTPGAHTVKAHYYGNATYATADSAPTAITVTQ